MKRSFTHLIAQAINARPGVTFTAVWLLLLLFQMMGQTAWAQTISSISPSCATVPAGQSLVLTITGTDFRTGGGNNAAVVEVNSSSAYITPSNRSSESITVTIPAERVTTPSITIIVVQGSGGNFQASNPFTVNVSRPAGAAGVISGLQSVCAGSQAVYSVGAIPNATTYQWTLPTGATIVGNSTGSQVTVNFTGATSGNISVAGVNRCGVAGVASTLPVTVNPLPAAPVAEDVARCGPGEITLRVANITAGVTYRWYNGSGVLVGEGSLFRTPYLEASTTYYLAAVGQGGCESAARIPVAATIRPLPVASITADTPQCDNPSGPNVFGITGNAENGTHVWQIISVSDGTSATIADANTLTPTVSVTEPGTVRLRLTVTSEANGCLPAVAEINLVVEPIPAPLAAEDVQGGERCGPGSVVLTVLNPGTGFTYRWYASATGGQPLGEGTTFETESLATSDTYYVAVVNGAGCESDPRTPVSASVTPLPIAAIATETPQCENTDGATVFELTGTVTSGDYVWEIVEGESIATIANILSTTPTVSVSQPGTVRVRLTVTSDNGCGTDVAEVELVVNPVPEALVASDVPGVERCGPGSVTLTATGAPANGTYRWYTAPTGGDLAFTGAVFTTPSLESSKTYYVAAVGEEGCESDARLPVTAGIIRLPVAMIEAETPQCDNPSGNNVFALTGRPDNFTTYTWEIVSGSEIATITGATSLTPQVTVSGTGTVRIRFTVANGNNSCPAAVEELDLVVNPLPAALAQGDVTGAERCGPGSVTLRASGAPAGGSYRWYASATGGQILGEGAAFTTTVSQTTDFYVAALSSAGCESTGRVAVRATVNEVPIVNAGADQVACSGGASTSFTLNGSASLGTVEWSVISGTADIADNEALSTTVNVTSASAILRLTATSAGCTTTDDVVLRVNPLPTADAGPAQAKCATPGGTSFTLAGTVTDGDGVWSVLGSTGSASASIENASSLTSAVTVTGTGTVTLQLTANSNTIPPCGSATSTVTLTVNPLPVANAGGNRTVCSGEEVTLGVAPVTGYTYQWSPATGLSAANVAQPTVRITNTDPANISRTYTVTVTANGCSSTSAATITVRPALGGNTISAAQTICEGTAPNTLTGSTPTGGGGVGTYTYTWESSTTSATAGFNAAPGNNTGQNYSPGTLRDRTWFRRVVRSSACAGTTVSISTPVEISVTPTTTYTLVLTASPFPVCPGVNTTYTATVLANVESVNYPANPRYEQITWVGGTDVSDQFVFDWWKNDVNDRANGQVVREISLSGLSSTDYYTVRATPKSGASLSCPSFANRPDLVPANPGSAVLFSNRIYLGRSDNYGVSISRLPTGSICPGTPVEFTATPNAEYVNLTMEWVVTNSAGTVIQTTPFSASRTFTSSTLNNGDVVSLNFTSAENRCQPAASSNTLTMVVVTPQTLTGGGAFCAGSAGVPVGIGSSQEGVNYQLIRTVNGNAQLVATRAGTGGAISFGNQATAGSYTVQPVSANGACPPAYGPVNVFVTPLPTAFAVTGGGEACANGGGVPVGLASSETGVNYQLRRTVNGSTTNLATVAGTGNPISFGNQTVTGAYSVVATSAVSSTTAACSQSMTGSANVVINPLPIVALEDASACRGTRATVSANVTSGTGGYTYSWSVPAAWQGPVPTTPSFETTVPGTYTLTVTDAENCASATASSTVSFTTPVMLTEPVLGVYLIENNTQWRVEASEEDPIPEGAFGEDPVFVWYRRIAPADDWGMPVQSGTSNEYIEAAPGENVQIKAEVFNGATCRLYALTNIGVVPLPVELIYFKTLKQGNEVLLEWATASEENNAGFEVQVSEDGFNFRKLAFVETKNGNAIVKQVYRYADKSDGKYGTRYYRLKQLDLNGNFEYFGPSVVTFGDVASQVKAFPNPFNTELTLDIAAEQDGEVQVTVANAAGRQVLQRSLTVEKGFNTKKLEISPDLPHGVYFVRVYLEGRMYNLKLLKQ